jgi:glycosyltransferase involved in cell wall biosynthesis
MNGPVQVKFPLYGAKNLMFLFAPLPAPQMRDLQMRSAVHLCPSVAEGFGHSINEARAAAAVVITTGAPPMNEFVDDGVNGLLVPVQPGNTRPYHLSTAHFATPQDVCSTVERALAMSEAERKQMGSLARTAFLEERQQFHRRVAQFLDG